MFTKYILRSLVIFTTAFFVPSSCTVDFVNLPPACNSTIYCHGNLLHTVQMAAIFHDSKTFVDMKLKQSPAETFAAFELFMEEQNHEPTKSKIWQFVHDNFEEPGKEFEKWNLSDWIDNPKFLKTINDAEYRAWAKELNQLWNFLGRKMTDHVRHNQDLYSIIYVPNPVIVPGGRFREFYYWDSYWIIKGLLLSEMYDTVKGMLMNFLSIVENFGFIPNGGRIYYLRRSQPPMLIPMVKAYLEYTNDVDFIRDNMMVMESEFDYWLKNHSIILPYHGRNYQMFIYRDFSKGPRPESYREDILTAQYFPSDAEKEGFYSELKAAAESGWDFSSRWFIHNGINAGNLTNLHTRSIIPVELNAMMYWNAKLLEEFHTLLGNETAAAYYGRFALKIKEAVTNVLWDNKQGVWFDYDMMNKRKRDYFYPTNISPLWTDCYDKSSNITDQVMQYLWKQNEQLISMSGTATKNHLGGVPTTFNQTGEQWDYPNAWPPLQYIMIMSLHNTDNLHAQELAFELADRWVRTNFVAYNETKAMYEKYDSRKIGGHGGGGEYEIQLGFGWTNGVVMELLDRYGDKLRAIDQFDDVIEKDSIPVYGSNLENVVKASSGETRTFITALLVLTISLAVGLIGVYVCKIYLPQNEFLRRPTLSMGSGTTRPRSQYKELRNMYSDNVVDRKPRR